MAVGILLMLGLYYPTVPSNTFSLLAILGDLIYLGLLVGMIACSDRRPSVPTCIALISIAPLLLVFSGTSGLSTLRLGALAGYSLLSMMYLVDLRRIQVPRWLDHLWRVVNIINIACGVAIVAGFRPLDDFFIAHYSYGYDELVSNMLLWHKPVLTFASHSYAAFFFYLFFWTNLEIYKTRSRKISIAFSICYVFLTLWLLSVTAVVLSAVAIVQLAVLFWSSVRHKVAFTAVILCILLMSIAFWNPKIPWRNYFDVAERILRDPHNGLMGRFLPGGTMYDDIEYLKDHPFSPVGASYKAGLMFGDSGPIEYILRGSLPFLLIVYGGFYYFLRRNLVGRRHVYFLFAVVLAFELGLSTLIYFRMLCLLPVFVVYLNNLQRESNRDETLASGNSPG